MNKTTYIKILFPPAILLRTTTLSELVSQLRFALVHNQNAGSKKENGKAGYVMQADLCMDICAFPACKMVLMNSGTLITILFQEIPRLELPIQPYFTSQCTIIMIKTSCIVTYLFLHLSLPYAILTNGTQDGKQCPVVKENTVCTSYLIHISEN